MIFGLKQTPTLTTIVIGLDRESLHELKTSRGILFRLSDLISHLPMPIVIVRNWSIESIPADHSFFCLPIERSDFERLTNGELIKMGSPYPQLSFEIVCVEDEDELAECQTTNVNTVPYDCSPTDRIRPGRN